MSLFPEIVEKESGKYYIAAVPPEPFFTSIKNLKLDIADRFGIIGATFSPPHITFTTDFNVELRYEAELVRRLTEVISKHAPFLFQLSGFHKMGPQAIAISHGDITQLKALREAIRKELMIFFKEFRIPVKKLASAFNPHMTIAYRGHSDGPLDKVWEEFEGQTFDAAIPIHTVTILKQNGKSWDEFQSLPLKERQPAV